MDTPRKLIAVCGADLQAHTMAPLAEAVAAGCHVLALDSLAWNVAGQHGISVTTLDTWIKPSTMRALAVTAAILERQWFVSAAELFEYDGICWPLFDHQAMHWFWRDTVLATTFSTVFLKSGGLEIRVLGDLSPQPTVYYDMSHPWKLLFQTFSQASNEMFGRYGANLGSLEKLTESLPGRRANRFRRPLSGSPLNYHNRQYKMQNPLRQSGPVCFAFNAGEAERFTSAILHVAQQFEVNVVLFFGDENSARDLSTACGVPVSYLPLPQRSQQMEERLRFAFNSVLERSGGFPLRHVLELYQHHFDHYLANRWPTLSASLQQWISLWTDVDPRCVITSQLVDAESQLPAEAANRLGIPTMALPHGGIYFGDEAQVSRYNLYSFDSHRKHLSAGGLAGSTLVACRNAVAHNEYAMDAAHRENVTSGRVRILVLCCGATLEGNLMPLVNLGAQIETIRALQSPPPALAGQVEIKFKVHPGWPDLETFRAAGADVERDVLPVKSDLHSLIPCFDLFIDMNVSGSAVLHVIRAGKPVIFFWPARINVGHWYEELFLRSGVLAEKPERLWDIVNRYITEKEYAERLSLKASRFFRTYLDDSKHPELADLMHLLPNLPEQKVDQAGNAISTASSTKESTVDIFNIDADASFYYGEIPEDHLNWIFSQNESIGDIEAATHRYCSETGNEYFRKYALDPRRALYLGLCGSIEGLRVLDYGCGLGSLGIPAARAGANVTFVDSCLARLRFASTRCREGGLTETSFYGCKTWRSLPFAPGSFDLIVLNGIMEWVPKTIGATFETVLEAQLDFLKVMAGLLKPTGRIFLAIENRFALQYLMGYPEDHTDIRYLSIMPRREANELHRQQKGDDFVTWTWGYEDYRRLLPKVGLILAEEYGMFPDYRFPQVIAPLQDTAAVKRGMLLEEYEAPAEERRRMIDYLAEMGQLHQAVYSFGFILGKSEN